MNETIVDLIRHGEPVGGRKIRGQQDDPLSDKGWQQMEAAVGNVCPWDMIISSPLQRCFDFAQHIANRYQRELIQDARFREIGFGEWEGKTPAELQDGEIDLLQRFRFDPLRYRPSGAETLEDFRDRVIGAWSESLQRFTGKHILIVGHAGMMRMIIRHILDIPLDKLFRIQVDNAGITRIVIRKYHNQDFPHLVFHNGSL